MATNITTIVLKTNDGSENSSDEGFLSGNSSKNQNDLAKDRKKLLLNTIHNTGVAAVQEVVSMVSYDLNTYLSLTENYKLQVQMENVSTTIGKVTSMASSVMSGAITGAQIGGGAGAAIGAVIALVGATTKTAIDLVKQYASQNMSLATNDMQASYSHSRLGLVDNGRGTQN